MKLKDPNDACICQYWVWPALICKMIVLTWASNRTFPLVYSYFVNNKQRIRPPIVWHFEDLFMMSLTFSIRIKSGEFPGPAKSSKTFYALWSSVTFNSIKVDKFRLNKN